MTTTPIQSVLVNDKILISVVDDMIMDVVEGKSSFVGRLGQLTFDIPVIAPLVHYHDAEGVLTQIYGGVTCVVDVVAIGARSPGDDRLGI